MEVSPSQPAFIEKSVEVKLGGTVALFDNLETASIKINWLQNAKNYNEHA